MVIQTKAQFSAASCTSRKLVLKPLCEKEKEDVLCGYAEIAGGACKTLSEQYGVYHWFSRSANARQQEFFVYLRISGPALSECLHLSTLRIGNRSQDRNLALITTQRPLAFG